ncbi:MAG TPA: SIS domain-containing protein [Cryptosporangiaceae bacterium]|nr:SIS domain-containing protein [Cryptosporangiaceae bacterium]
MTLEVTVEHATEAFARRIAPGNALAADAERVGRACYDIALRFHRGGKLITFGNGGCATDAQHVVVEFVHPVIVGKRALPAISLANDASAATGLAASAGMDETFTTQLDLMAHPDDIALGISPDGNCGNVARGLQVAREKGLLTIALTGGDGGRIAQDGLADHLFVARSDDPRVVKEIHVTTYHLLWELVHVFFEQPGVLDPGVVR